MSISSVKDLLSGKVAAGQNVTVAGWVKTRRDSKAGFSFISVSDGSCFAGIQVVAESKLENYESEILKLTTGCSVVVDGELQASLGKGQSVELHAQTVKVMGFVEDPDTYPMSAKRHSVEYLREYAHLRPRTNLIGAVMRIRNAAAFAIHSFFQSRGFMWVSTPLITASDAEGAGEMFTVTNFDLNSLPKDGQGKVDFSQDFFGRHSYLTVSGQLEAETYACAFSKVYTFGPTFRAENSNTTRHLAEFWMVEPEMAFTDLDGCAQTAGDMLKAIFSYVLEHCRDDLEFIVQRVDKEAITRLENFVKSDFAQVEYTEAIEILKKAKKQFQYPVEWGIDLQSEHERYLAEEHFHSPVVVRDYPKDIKAFYMRANEDGKTVAAMDVLAPGIGEIIGGSQREERIELLDKRMEELHMNKENYWWYRDLRRYGSVVHSGFGLGFERIVDYITGVGNLRDCIPFPRTPQHAEF
ncbi:MAG: asparagine--tRNA ligase [Succinivibrio sp.]|jgi:asparaginyl-tRNA synthetase|nr:asparagine--tRNA ligase [Succinivibrio sp.]